MPETVTKLIPLDRITLDKEIQCRVRLNSALVEEYKAIIEAHKNMDPVVAYTPDDPGSISKSDPLILADGWHRVEAYRAAEKEKIPVEIRQGDRSVALDHAITSMCRHGLRATNADKRRAATLAVEDPVLGQLSDAAIAKKLGVSQSLVSEARRGVTPETKKKKTVTVGSHKRAAPGGAKSVTARERKDDDKRPTKTALLKEIESWVNDDMIDESELIELFNQKESAYRWFKRDGTLSSLRLTGKNGANPIEVQVVVTSVAPDRITLKYEGSGTFVLEGG